MLPEEYTVVCEDPEINSVCVCVCIQMLNLSRLSPDLERLNSLGYRLPLNDQEIKKLQNLNRSWTSTSAQSTERFRYKHHIQFIFVKPTWY